MSNYHIKVIQIIFKYFDFNTKLSFIYSIRYINILYEYDIFVYIFLYLYYTNLLNFQYHCTLNKRTNNQNISWIFFTVNSFGKEQYSANFMVLLAPNKSNYISGSNKSITVATDGDCPTPDCRDCKIVNSCHWYL